MTVPNAGKSVRAGSTAKRAAIMAAARELFVREGADRVSMDAIAAEASVSKRTVYDYFGTKDALLLRVIEEAARSLLATLGRARDQHLADDAGIGTAEELECALVAFALDLGTSVIGSADYATVFALFVQRSSTVAPDLESLSSAPEELVAERLAHFTEVGLLEIEDPRLAADHFNALTLLLAYSDQPGPVQASDERVRRTMIDGVHAFMRAYAVR